MSGAFADAVFDEGPVVFRIDYLAVTFHGWSAARVWLLLDQHLGEGWGPKEWEVRQDDDLRLRAVGPHGTWLEADRRNGWSHLCFKGQACGVAGTTELLKMLRAAQRVLRDELRASRIDVAFDDFNKRITPEQMHERFWEAGRGARRPGVRCRARRGVLHLNAGDQVGATFEVGRRSSGRRLRLYDKEEQSRGRIKAMRCELETRDDFATALLRDMLRASHPWQVVRAALRHLVAFLDFMEDEESDERATWWSEFVGEAKAAVVGKRRPACLLEFLRTLLSQFAGGFQVLSAAVGGAGPAAALLIGDGSEPSNPKHRRFIREIRSGTLVAADLAEALRRRSRRTGHT